MKPSKYNICLTLDNKCILFNAISKRFFYISKDNKESFLQILSAPDEYAEEYGTFIEKMKDQGFIVQDSYDELNIIKQRYERHIHLDTYILMILPTYACNVACWYCTQRHRNLHLKDEDIDKIKKHIVFHLEHNDIKGLQLSWFGGEPLIDFHHIYDISVFAKKYCNDHNYKFKNVITTNGTLLTKQMLDIMKDLDFAFFQITIDGTQTEHDKVKVIKGKSAYEMTLKNICLIADTLPDAEICVRYNYTVENLQPESFLSDLNSFLSQDVRSHIVLSLMKVWQEDEEKIDEDKIFILAENARKAGYKVKVGADFSPCYVENINYNSIFPNGLVDKCDNNDPDNCRGNIAESGEIKWDEEISFFDYNIFGNVKSECLNCIYLPLCYGPCPKERELSYQNQQHLKCRFLNKDKKWHLDILQYCKNITESNLTSIIVLFSVFLSFSVCGRAFSQTDSIKDNGNIYKDITLNEVTIKGMNCVSYPDKDVWIITHEMRKNTFDTFSLLQKIPGFTYNKMTRVLSYWGTENILITIDGIKKDNDYGGNLANMRFKKIEIYNNPKGQYDDYDIVINLITYEDWQGYDAMGLSTTELFPSSKHGNLLGRAMPDIYYTYTRPKFDLSTYYSYIYEDTRNAQCLEIKEGNIVYNSISNPSTTNKLRANKHEGYFDFDYKINKYHTISAKYTFTDNCHHSDNDQQLYRRDQPEQTPLLISREGHNHYDVIEHTASVFYQMRCRKWHLSSEATYNVYSEKNRYSYNESQGYSTDNVLNNFRHSFLFSMEVDREIVNVGNLKTGCRVFHRKYKSDNVNSDEVFDSKQNRVKFYFNMSRRFSNKLSGNIGLTMEHIRSKSPSYDNEKQIIWGGNITLRYGQWGDKFRFDINYKSTTSYPMLYQTMSIKNHSDSLLVYSGNSSLKASTLHHLSLHAKYRQIGLTTTFSYSPNAILSIYKQNGDLITKTYDNIEKLSYQFNLGYHPKDIKLNNGNLHFTIQMMYGGNYIDQPFSHKHISYLTGLAQITYNHNKYGSLQLDYRRLSKKILSTQTISRKANDGWYLLIAKDFFQSRLNCAIEYVLPIKIGVTQDTYSDTQTHFYSYFVKENTYEYFRNRISFHLTYHIADGHTVNKQKNEQSRENEVYNNYF